MGIGGCWFRVCRVAAIRGILRTSGGMLARNSPAVEPGEGQMGNVGWTMRRRSTT